MCSPGRPTPIFCFLCVFLFCLTQTSANFTEWKPTVTEMPSEKVIELKNSLREATARMTETIATFPYSQIFHYDAIGAPFKGLCIFSVPHDDNELNALFANLSSQYGALAERLVAIGPFWCGDLPYHLDISVPLFSDNLDYAITTFQDFSFVLADVNNRTALGKLFGPGLGAGPQYYLESIPSTRFADCLQMYQFAPVAHKLVLESMTGVALAMNARENSSRLFFYGRMRTGAAQERNRERLQRIERFRDGISRLYEENVFVGLESVVKTAIDEELVKHGNSVDIAALKRRIDRTLEANYTTPEDQFGVFLWLKGCSLRSYQITFANDSTATHPFEYRTLNVLLHRSRPASAAAKENRRVFEAQKSSLEEVLDVRTEGLFFATVSAASAKENVERLTQIHKFYFVAVLIFKDEDDVCAVSSALESLNAVKSEKSYFTDSDFRVVALFGF